MDERFLENASETEQLHREAAIRQATRAEKMDPRFDGVHCVEEDCGDPIPEARRALGKFRCITCQHLKENPHARP